MKIVYTENPLCSYVEMSGAEKEDFKLKLYNWWRYEWEESEEDSISWTEHQYPYYIEALTSGEWHLGDCTKVPCSCTKCLAEEILGICTTEGLKCFHYISSAFKNTTKLEEAILTLSKSTEYTEEWHQPHIERWSKERLAALESLIEYKEKHFSEHKD